MSDDNKHCRKCDLWRPRAEFTRDAKSPDGRRRVCSECDSKRRSAARGGDFEIEVEEPQQSAGARRQEVQPNSPVSEWPESDPSRRLGANRGTLDDVTERRSIPATPDVSEHTDIPPGGMLENATPRVESARPDPPLRPPDESSGDVYFPPLSRNARVLLVPDCHHPYSDKRAWQVLLQAGREYRPDIIVVLGDFADFYAVSSHSKNPNRRHNLESEVEAVNEALDELDALGARKRIFISGNHEDRLERYLADHAPALFNMVRVRDLFRLSERGWQYVPYKRHARVGKLFLTHDTGRAGRYAHYQSQADFGGHNVVIGHTHRIGFMVEGSAQGEPHFAAQLGWLGDFDAVDYLHQVKARRDWSHGFGVALLEPSGNVHLTPVPIVGRSCVVSGQLVTLDWKAAA